MSAEIVTVGAEGELTLGTSLAKPTSLSQVGVDPGQVQQLGLPFQAKGPTGVFSLRPGDQRWLPGQGARWKTTVEEVQSIRQALLQGGLIGEMLTDDGLMGDGLMRAFDDAMLGRWGLVNEADFDAQRDQPQMEAGRKRRSAGIVIEDAVVIETDPFRQPMLHERPPQHQLIILGVGMGRIQARQAINFHSTKEVTDVNDRH